MLAPKLVSVDHRVHTEWQRPLFDGTFIMMEKLAQAGEGAGCTPAPFHSIYHHVQSCKCMLQLRGQIHSPYFISTLMYSVVSTELVFSLLYSVVLSTLTHCVPRDSIER
jgi:hypothetical protein